MRQVAPVSLLLLGCLLAAPAIGSDAEVTIAFEYGLDNRCEPVIVVLEAEPADAVDGNLLEFLRRMMFEDGEYVDWAQIESAGGVRPQQPMTDAQLQRIQAEVRRKGPWPRHRGMRQHTGSQAGLVARCYIEGDVVVMRIIDGAVGSGLVELDDYEDGEMVVSRLFRITHFVDMKATET